jgi:prophage tail gpP-like protein
MAYNPDEIAKLIVGGGEFTDWQTVWVQHRWADAFSLFRFTAAERGPPDNWQLLQFKPCDPCTITLAGKQAIKGHILTRQTAYDKSNHVVQLSGKSLTTWAAKSSAYTKSGNFDGMNFVQVAKKLFEGYPNGVEVVGTPDPTPFDKLQIDAGKKIWDVLENLARPRGIVMGSDQFGNFLIIGPHTKPVNGQLTEGVNIKSMQCTISVDENYTEYRTQGQSGGNDQHHGKDASQQQGVAGGTGCARSVLIVMNEQPVKTPAEMQARAHNEAVWHEGYTITASVVVQGWVRWGDGSDIWRVGDNVIVESPMAMLNGVAMKIQNATFTQDDRNGTQTTLDLVLPWLLKDNLNLNVGKPGIPKEPAKEAPPPNQQLKPTDTGNNPTAPTTPPPTTPPVVIPPFDIPPGGA